MNRIGIIGVMREEIVALKRRMTVRHTENKAGMTFYIGTIDETEVVVVRTGTGKVSAAVCTQILIDVYAVEYIINTGVAGGLSPNVNIGDVIVATDTKACEVDTRVFGDEKEDVPHMDKSFFETNKKMLESVTESAKQIVETGQVIAADMMSGDQFLEGLSVTEEVYTTFTAYCAEMEAVAIAHTCYLNQVPFILIRTISDKVDNSGEMNYDDFVQVAAKSASKLIESVICGIK